MMPVVYIHLGNLPAYLKLSVQQARKYNQKVVLISDTKPDFDCEWIDVNTVSEDVARLSEVYAHMSTNSKRFETSDDSSFTVNNSLVIDLVFRIRFKQKYYTVPYRKVISGSKYPRINIGYKKAIPGLNTKADYDLATIQMDDNIQMGCNSRFRRVSSRIRSEGLRRSFGWSSPP